MGHNQLKFALKGKRENHFYIFCKIYILFIKLFSCLPEMLGNCTNLTRVELNDNNLTYLSGHLFKNNRNLEYLYLQNNRLKKLLKRPRKKIIYNWFNLNSVGFKSQTPVASFLTPQPCLRLSEPCCQSLDYRDKFPKMF